eukprot:TRINITY_DN12684_c0_g1_i1.p1 TRINITY_DN12684_c0_g1~~TRINITY_DN12684_c0_g1_i1.p1  ORF type:complete len:368 (+),score=83.63 TRINITY_DN12684_c0_g1_i1:102-1205(+)
MAANLKITKRANLDDDIIALLRSKQLDTAKEVLSRSDLELVWELEECYNVVQKIQKAVSKYALPKTRTVLDLFYSSVEGGFLATGLKALDDFLHGGVATGSITVIVGPAGSGKTQFCHMMCCLATLPKERGGMGDEATVLYLDTEGAFAPARLAEMLSALDTPLDAIASCVSRIKMIGRIASIEEFEAILKDLEATVAAHDVKLIVVDSIAALVRKDFDLTSIALRQGKLSSIASQLKRLAEAFQIPIVIVNQVTTQFVDGPGSDRSFVTAALGTSWSHSVNTRLVIEPTTGKNDFGLKQQLQDISLRRLTLAKSPTAPVVMMAVQIWAGGLKMALNPEYTPQPPPQDDAMQVDDGEERVDEDIFAK